MELKTKVLVDNLRFPESPRWHHGKLWFCDYATNQILNVDLYGNVQLVIEPSDLPTAIDWTPDGRLLVVAANERRLLRMEDNALVQVADMSNLVEYACGEMVVDREGRAYIGNIGFDFGTPPPVPNPGSIMLVTPGSAARIVAEGFGFPNGIVITPDGQTLIVAESHGARLTGFTIQPDGSLSHRRAWAQFDDSLDYEEGRFTPDGICLDVEGAVWVAAHKQALRVREGAHVVDRIPIDDYALACMLGGPERRTLFIATTKVLNPVDDNVKGGIETVQVDVPGAGLPRV